ncbi:MAG: outer membrane beta-barrel protein [Planctomycetaceae bacterium]|nr:outer membrane beta-barrel protein [Planctomycetaceae bacterium]
MICQLARHLVAALLFVACSAFNLSSAWPQDVYWDATPVNGSSAPPLFGRFGLLENPQPYLQLHGGAVLLQDVQVAALESSLLSEPISMLLESNDGFAVGGAVGLRLSQHLSIEQEFTYRANEWDRIRLDISDLGIDDLSAPLDRGIKSYATMSNLKLDMPLGRIRPYIGGGVGFSFFDAEMFEPDNDLGLSLRYPSFTYQGIGGVAIPLTPRAEFFTEYRYFAMTPVDLRLSVGGDTMGIGAAYQTNNFFAGFRFYR